MAMVHHSPYDASFAVPDIDLTGLLLDRNLNGTAPDKAAIIDGHTGQTVFTYQSLRDGTVRFGGFLQQQLKVARGDVVAYMSFNTTYYPIVVHGILATGATASAFNPAYHREEIAHVLRLARPSLVLIQAELVPNLRAALDLLPTDIPKPRIHVLGGHVAGLQSHDVADILSKPLESVALQRPRRSTAEIAQDLAFICFSSGTSGLVKGVRLSHANVVTNIFQQGHCLQGMFNPQTVFTLAVPFYHILGLGGFCCQYVSNGAPIVVFVKFELPALLKSISRDRVTHVNVVPPMALALLQSPLAAHADFSSVVCLMNAAAPLKQSLADALCKRMNCVLTQWYGMTEASPSVISQREDEVQVAGTVGRLLPGMQLRIVDEGGNDVPQGSPGELLIRGPNLMRGYIGDPEFTRSAYQDGFFKTGDIGYVDSDGFVYLVDRAKSMIKVKGNQVAPAELEALLLSHPSVTDAAVCGVYVDDEATEYPIAYITTPLAENEAASIVEEVQNHVDSQVAHYKRLQGGVHVLDAIPRNPSGKILRRFLPAQENKDQAAEMVRRRRKERRSKL